MRILLFIDSLGSGGAQRQLVNIANGLSKHHEVAILLYNPTDDFYVNRILTVVPVTKIKRSEKKGFSFKVLSELINSSKSFDITVTFLLTANIYGALAKLVRPKLCLVTCEMSITNEAEGYFRRKLADFANKIANHTICNSFYQARYVKECVKDPSAVTTIWNGIEGFEYRQPKEKKKEDSTFLIVGRVSYPKNGSRLLEGLCLFYKKHGFMPPVSWAGRLEQDARSQKMIRQMQSILDNNPAIKNKFKFLGETKHIQSLYHEYDTLISASIFEGVPNVICEAMLSGCPVIASNISDNQIILGSMEERGFFCDPYSPRSIATAIEKRVFIQDQTLIDMTDAARKYAKQEFSQAGMIEKYLETFSLILTD